jgi:hypothetical protein
MDREEREKNSFLHVNIDRVEAVQMDLSNLKTQQKRQEFVKKFWKSLAKSKLQKLCSFQQRKKG